MNYLSISKEDMCNGEGSRVVLWVSGCEHKCEKCRSKFSWDYNGGKEFTNIEVQDILCELSNDYISGITFSGGDPLHPNNIDTVTSLSKMINKNFPDKDIWCYTGYLYKDIKHLEIMKYIDILVDGKYKDELSIPSPKWCGSNNQHVINVKQSLEKGEMILYSTLNISKK